ncbi:hypothetical protein BW13_10640 [Bifidobacterium sp. UTCIF-37]|uniref:response regulator transcription factor n=1 Tax=unclassified Bifidobacterium TaxID=2608897 RepID=UPI00112E052A|nr:MULTISPECIES: response regulator transcription factor [unclassified Bifidobacterium]TPF85459.1 hypothetical protein BW13_10640 [Bifidobacterium sp. UTCIF-37]TPF88929.1 hypothetical protein BW11_06155 [Bifidobacterium sp. UTCIF-38]
MSRIDTRIDIGIIDNDCCASRMIATTVQHMSTDFKILWITETAQIGIEHCLYDSRKPHVLIVDMELDGIPGPDLCRRIRTRTPSIGLIGVTAYPLKRFRSRCIANGAQALLSKRQIFTPQAAIIIRHAANGMSNPYDTHFQNAMESHQKLTSADNRTRPSLSIKEIEILSMYARGDTTHEIAVSLGIAEATVFSHTHHAMQKLDVRNRKEAIRRCIAEQLI